MKAMRLFLTGLLFAATAVASPTTKSEVPWINSSLTPDIAVYPKTQRIQGVTFSVWGENEQNGFALGFVNGLKGHSSGFAWGVFVNYGDSYVGAQLAMVNWMKQDFTGLQVGFVNLVNGKMTGMQYGAVNYAVRMTGLQLGLVNYAESVDSGVQVGLVNIIAQNKVWFSEFPHAVAPAMVFVNWRFH